MSILSPQASTVCQLSLGSYSLELHRRRKAVQSPRIAILFSHKDNIWAQGITSAFRTHLESLLQLPDFEQEHIIVESTREAVQLVARREGLFSGRFTHVITLGWLLTNQVRELRVLQESAIQHLYCIPGVSRQVSLESAAEPGWGQMSGVYSRPLPYGRYVQALMAIRPAPAKTVCIAYDPCKTLYGLDSFMAEQRELLQKELGKVGIDVIFHHWSYDDMRAEDLVHKIKKAEAVITLRDEAVYAHQKELVEMCKKEKVLFCSSELDSVASGAAIGCGNAGGYYAAPLAHQLAAGWLTGRALHLVEPYELKEQPTIRFNPYTILMQGVQLQPEQQALLEMKSIFDKREE